MRDIKFRAWDKIDHDWYKRDNPPARMTYFANPIIDDDGYIHFESVGQAPIGDHGEDRFVLMQYTGLKDKNGKEIYEGDIYCKRQLINGYQNKPNIVEWWGGRFTLTQDVIDYQRAEIKVIGNIYENKEILK